MGDNVFSEGQLHAEVSLENEAFVNIGIKIASGKVIRDKWSRGEIKKPETINYRTFKPEKGGLFCEKIFGPQKDWECACGKYKKIKHKGIVCDRCGVEVTLSKVRRERMAHIELAVPVVHIWFFKTMPSRIGNILGMSTSDLERVIYYEEYVVTSPGQTDLQKKQLLNDNEYREAQEKWGADSFTVKMGGEAVQELLRTEDLSALVIDLKDRLRKTKSMQARMKLAKRLKIIEGFATSQNKQDWMVLGVIPVIPPDLRPLVPLDGGRFATSDLNDLYRRVINRNNRLRSILKLKTPDVIVRNEKRMLQEAVDALFDNGRHGHPVMGAGNRPLKALSEMLKGKQGRFRQNLLGKRVDYSGRSVIVVGPELRLNQCGLPKKMALDLFEPFIVKRLKDLGLVYTIRSAKKLIQRQTEEVWEALEEIIKGHPVLLNRAPTLHRLGIQAFEPVLIEGKAIRIHPLVCTAFNADFDGDQMAVHVPLSIEAQMECRLLMLSTNNIFSPANGNPITTPTQDIVLGCHYLTKEKEGEKGEGKLFSDRQEALIAFEDDQITLHAKIRVRIDGKIIDTIVGRVIFNNVFPKEFPFVNIVMSKSELGDVILDVHKQFGNNETVKILDKLKKLGFEYATLAGISIAVDDLHIPREKDKFIKEAREEVLHVETQYRKGLITDGERYNNVIDIWTTTTDKISDRIFEELDPFNPILMMANSGARGSKQQIRQLAGMRGLMAKPSGEIIESPIKANFREGLTMLEYFISTHGARKGLADTALKTADSGYLTRRLVDVAQDVIIAEIDCGTVKYIDATPLVEGGDIIQSLRDRILGRVAAEDIRDPLSSEIIVQASTEITEELAQKIEDSGLERVRIRSGLTCDTKRGICVMCYGRNLGTGRLAELGEAVGIIAAQSIGEPGTQLTMRTFHIGGTASRVVEASKHEAKSAGLVKYHSIRWVENRDKDIVVLNRNGELMVVDERGREKERYPVVPGARIKVRENHRVKQGQLLVEWDPFTTPILTEVTGTLVFHDIVDGVTIRDEFDEVTGLARRVIIEDQEGQLQPRVSVKEPRGSETSVDADSLGETRGRYMLPVGAHLLVQDGQEVFQGDIISKIPRETTKTKDITGGLPRVAELFEARKPKEEAVLTEIDGVVEFAGFVKGMRKIVIRADDGETREYLIPRGKHISVHEGDRVKAGEALMDGSPNPHDYLAVLGDRELQRYLVNEVQEVYRLQGVTINDKHIEIIVRQMLRRVRIEEVGGTDFVVGELVDKFVFQEESEKAIAGGKPPATAKPVLLGITKASLSTDSFISAASFQETTRVLTEAAIAGKVDELRGLKENVIVGRLIPAGTGLSNYTRAEVLSQEVAEGPKPVEEPLAGEAPG